MTASIPVSREVLADSFSFRHELIRQFTLTPEEAAAERAAREAAWRQQFSDRCWSKRHGRPGVLRNGTLRWHECEVW